MGEAQEVQLQIIEQESKEAKGTNSAENGNVSCSRSHQPPDPYRLKRWLQITIYAIFVLSGQSVATLLGRLYYEKGGKSKWMATLVQPAGFIVLLPFLFLSPPPKTTTQPPPSALLLAPIYASFGIFLAADSMLFAVGLMYLPASTFSLICACQLGFNALFSFFINSQKLTPFIINSLVLLTTSSTLLVFTTTSSSNQVSKGKYTVGFLCTTGAAAGYALILSLGQLFYQKILKRATFRVILEMIIYESLVATCAILVGLFASGEWKGLKREMDEFRLGKVSYVMTLVWTAICWQVFSVGAFGLIFTVSSLFTNVISTLSLPIVPVFAVIFFHDRMDGVKVVAMLLAIWGFVSYIYQHYLDEFKSKDESDSEVPEVSSIERS